MKLAEVTKVEGINTEKRTGLRTRPQAFQCPEVRSKSTSRIRGKSQACGVVEAKGRNVGGNSK
jgi:hypothetical protein